MLSANTRLESQPRLILTNSDEDRTDFEHWQVGAGSVHQGGSLMFVWSKNWLVRASRSGSLLFERAPGTGVVLEVVPLTQYNAAYVLASDGRYDVIGPEAEQAEQALACLAADGPPSRTACNARREAGLLASVIEALNQVGGQATRRP